MIRLEIFAVGNLKEAWLRAGCEEYLKRMGLWSRAAVTELEEARLPKSPSPAQIAAALEKEGQHILEKLPKSSKVVHGGQSKGLVKFLLLSAVPMAFQKP